MVQVSQPYMTTGNSLALTGRTFVGKVVSLLFNMLPGFASAFLPKDIQGWFPLGLSGLISLLYIHTNSCPSSPWCHPTISSSVVPFSFCPQSFPASGSFPMSWLFPSGGQSIGVSASTSVLPMNSQDWFPLGWTGWISLQSKGLSRVFSNTTLLLQYHNTVQKHQFFCAQLCL